MAEALSNKRIWDISGLAVWMLVTFGVAAFASQFEPGPWYSSLTKPTWTPPGWLFGPVWGLLYLSMSISAWLVWRERTAARYLPLGLYLGQLLLNGVWSWLFFGRQQIGLALMDLVFLVVVLAVTIVSFLKVSKTSGFLMMPYILWCSFAAALNFQIWGLN